MHNMPEYFSRDQSQTLEVLYRVSCEGMYEICRSRDGSGALMKKSPIIFIYKVPPLRESCLRGVSSSPRRGPLPILDKLCRSPML